EEVPAVGGEGDGARLIRVGLQAEGLGAGLEVPAPGDAVDVACEEVPAVGRGGEGEDPADVALEVPERLARARVPQPRSVVGAGEEPAPVRRKRDGLYEPLRQQPEALAPRFGVPEPHRLIVAAREDEAAVGGEGDGGDLRGDGVEVALEVAELSGRLHVPDPRAPVPAAGEEASPIGGEREGGEPGRGGGAGEAAEHGAGLYVPQAGPVPSPPPGAPTVGGEVDGEDRTGRLSPPELRAAPGVPQAGRVVLAPGEDVPPIRRERDAVHLPLVPLEAAGLGAGRDIPQAGRAVLVAREGVPPVGRERDVPDLSAVPLEASELGAGGPIPEDGCALLSPREDEPAIGGEDSGGDPARLPQLHDELGLLGRRWTLSGRSSCRIPEGDEHQEQSSIPVLGGAACTHAHRRVEGSVQYA